MHNGQGKRLQEKVQPMKDNEIELSTEEVCWHEVSSDEEEKPEGSLCTASVR